MNSSICRILYTEDDQDTRELVTYVLATRNYEVVGAANYDDAMQLARTNHFDLYLIDNWMPGGSGIELCKTLREFDTWTPILFYSGAAYEGDKQQAFAVGAQGYLVKPTAPDVLIAEVVRIISVSQENRSGREPAAGMPSKERDEFVGNKTAQASLGSR
jgi:DNA-binding response OmpR family regulator